MKEIYRGKSIVVLRNKDEVRIRTGETEDKMHRTTLSRMFKRLGGFEGIDLHYYLKAGEGEKRGNGAFQYKYSLPRNPFDIPTNLADPYGLSINAERENDFTIADLDMNVGRTVIVEIYPHSQSTNPTARHPPKSISAIPPQVKGISNAHL